jgi:hypothetical protein
MKERNGFYEDKKKSPHFFPPFMVSVFLRKVMAGPLEY